MEGGSIERARKILITIHRLEFYIFLGGEGGGGVWRLHRYLFWALFRYNSFLLLYYYYTVFLSVTNPVTASQPAQKRAPSRREGIKHGRPPLHKRLLGIINSVVLLSLHFVIIIHLHPVAL